MFVSNSWHMCKLRLIDERGHNIVDLDWTNKFNGKGKWHTRDIPMGKEIIGLYCTTAKYDYSIPCVGFILWTPDSSLSEENSHSPNHPIKDRKSANQKSQPDIHKKTKSSISSLFTLPSERI